MKSFLLCSCMLLQFLSSLFSQSVGVGTAIPNTSAALDITSTSKGLLIPRMNTTAVNAISNPAKGLMVYDTLLNQLEVNMGTAAFPNWQTIVARSGWNLTGNSSTSPVNQFIGTTDNQPLRFRVSDIVVGELHPVTGNVSWGLRAGLNNTTGFSNIAIGTDALTSNTFRSNLVAIGDSALSHNGQGNVNPGEAAFNTAIGSKSLFSNTRGSNNTATGYQSLFSNALTGNNTANGFQALFSNGGGDNTAVGSESLKANTLGNFNTAMGQQSLFSNTMGSSNTAMGQLSLFSNTIGNSNTGVGRGALLSNGAGSFNTAIGEDALEASSANDNTAVGSFSLGSNTTGTTNSALGSGASYHNLTGNSNTAIGFDALFSTINTDFNTAIGYHAGSNFNMGFNNTILGANCDINQNGLFNCIAIGQAVTCSANSQARIGNAATNSIGGFANWTNISDGRYKKNVKENVRGLDFIMQLRPVTYNLDITALNQKLNEGRGSEMNTIMKEAIAEKEKITQTGFVAQEVENAATQLGYDFSGVDKPKNKNDFYGLRYAEFVVPLVKAVQEQQAIIEALQKKLDDLEKKMK